MEFTFASNAEVSSIDTVPEHFRPMYQQSGEKFVLNPAFKSTAEAYDGLNKANRKIRKDLDDAIKTRPDLRPWKGLGSLLNLTEEEATPEALQTALAELVEKATKGDQSYKVNLDKMKAEMKKAQETALGAKDGELQGMSKTLYKHLVDNAALGALGKMKGASELLLPVIRDRVKVVKEGDEYVVRVVDAQGEARGDGKGGFLSVEDYVKELKASPTYGRAFDSDAPSGTGARPQGTAPRVPTNTAPADKSPVDKIAAGLRARSKA